ncbi:hypothetical protein F441_10562 [Phytophthora nicotianae CJ01A1]|uniref:Uncharacterized protein n=4 Tax=Phytophthora nicotianae TaxID=4792 RepID=W2R960_PHYN3|nr:hypothetical protein PPTG_02011 [Phytophthora nicotianae INRA-310]ETK84686.1 hypothetical protein L915_10379 [Phytophthora nicotianae]ETN21943.1 hypothetical protein PPTG_02011 [Phytophthora nicotianae INRA-310]ETP14513.1 hypothetical protein F441_10562 [Phytophthora nicotianae CJ01A1]
MFLTCCAESTYCLQCEINVGMQQLASEKPGVNRVTMPDEPAAVIENMCSVLGCAHPEHYLAVLGRFYSCATLAVQLLAMNVYIQGISLPIWNGVWYVVYYVDPFTGFMLSLMFDTDVAKRGEHSADKGGV